MKKRIKEAVDDAESFKEIERPARRYEKLHLTFKTNIAGQTKTLAGLSFKIFKSFLQPGIEFPHPRKNDYSNIGEALIGGRCISVNGIHGNGLCLDVKSLYPAAMAPSDQHTR